jgi:hypothetical protein
VTALLQFEIDKKRLLGFGDIEGGMYGTHTPFAHIYRLARAALLDTFDNGGTFVMVVSREKITIVQRKEADDFTNPPETKP